MKIKEQLRKLLEEDEAYAQIKEYKVLRQDEDNGSFYVQRSKDLRVVRKGKDPFHLERRKETRAICDEAIYIALLYGNYKLDRKAPTYILLDRCLIGTPYEKYLDTLRGLKVVCLRTDRHLAVLTALWYEKYRKRRTNITGVNRPRKRRGRVPVGLRADSDSVGSNSNAFIRQRDRRAKIA